MKLDLHVHSHVSDGSYSPAAVVRAAAASGLDVIALADHDTAAGVSEAQNAGRSCGVRVLPAIEISTRHGEVDYHILGYGIDPGSTPIQEHQLAAAERRQERMRGMVKRLQALGVRVSYEDVLREAGADARVLGRPHLARALLNAGHIRSFGEAFERYLADGGPAFVVQDFPSVMAGIEMIHAAGGVAVWAHPPLDIFDAQIRDFVGWGLDGIECFRPTSPPAQTLLFETAARDLGLFPTGGSDWHGPHRSRLGDFFIRETDIRGFPEDLLRPVLSASSEGTREPPQSTI